MSLPNHPALQQLRDLDRSLPGFHDQFSNVLCGEEYQRCVYGENYQQRVLSLHGDDLTWLLDRLDEARGALPFRGPSLPPPLTPRRLLIVSTLLAPLSGSVYVNSKKHAVQVGDSQRHTYFRLPFSRLIPTHLQQVALLTCIRGPSTVRRFVSNVCGCILSIHNRPLKCVLMPSLPPVHHF